MLDQHAERWAEEDKRNTLRRTESRQDHQAAVQGPLARPRYPRLQAPCVRPLPGTEGTQSAAGPGVLDGRVLQRHAGAPHGVQEEVSRSARDSRHPV